MSIVSRPATEEYRSNFDEVFHKEKVTLEDIEEQQEEGEQNEEIKKDEEDFSHIGCSCTIS